MGKCGIADIVKISEGSSFGDVVVHVKNKEDSDQREFIEILAHSNGFRLEKKQNRKLCILRIYGDTQEVVNDFISLYDRNIW